MCVLLKVIWTLVLCVFTVSGRQMDPVDFAKFLRKSDVAYWDIPSIVCYVNYTSNLETSHVGDLVTESSHHYGIFGIPQSNLRTCNVSKGDLLDVDISNDIDCFKKLVDYRKPGWVLRLGELLDWSGWHNHDCFTWWNGLSPYNIPQYDDHCPEAEVFVARRFSCQSGYSNFMLSIVMFICVAQILFWVLLLTLLSKARNPTDEDPMIVDSNLGM